MKFLKFYENFELLNFFLLKFYNFELLWISKTQFDWENAV